MQKLGLSLDEIHGYLDGTADLMMMIHRLRLYATRLISILKNFMSAQAVRQMM
ncbi:MAG: hypothetical protein L6V93_02825 [Clostridiales bacterium]|nr:MAG: hypothetical protein L6V93_02825 [Clostridiales bacterium]